MELTCLFGSEQSDTFWSRCVDQDTAADQRMVENGSPRCRRFGTYLRCRGRCPLIRAKRTSRSVASSSGFDPFQTKDASRYGARETAERQFPVRRQRSRRFAWSQRDPTNPFATRPTQPGVPRDGARFLRRANQTSSLAVRLSLRASQISGRLKSYSSAQSIHA